MDGLVTTDWLAEALGAADLLLLDASYTSTIPGSPPRDPRAEYEAGHIPGARFLDLDTLVDPASPLPSTIPRRDTVAARMRVLGARADSRIVLYDDNPHRTACRAWWVLRMFGIDAAILDGGLAKWKAEGRTLASGDEDAAPSDFEVSETRDQLRTLARMRANLETRAEQVADARSAARFTGEEADPRAAIASGHIPGSRNIPYGRFYNPDGTWKRGEALRAVFDEAGIDLTRPLAATCGSGITAAVIVFAAHLLGNQAALYDGSWTEWGADPATPKATGAA